MKGLIALDIDGTLTPPGEAISWEVIQYLHHLAKEEWQLMFVTGRTFHFGYQVLQGLTFPYFYAVQNGAITIEMPSQKILNKKYLDKSIIPMMERICEGEPTDFVIYTGFEFGDQCFYRSHKFSDELQSYLKARTIKFQEIWHDVPSFDNFCFHAFPSVKCFGTQEDATLIKNRIEDTLGLHVPMIRDPYNPEIFVAQATHKAVSKGQALKELIELLKPEVVIVAGDDYNDLTMLAEADIKVIMETAPKDMLPSADIIAPSAQKQGIIAGLNAAITLTNSRRK